MNGIRSRKTSCIHEYDLNGNRIAMTDISGKRTEYRYNDLDLLTDVYDNGIRQAQYEYNDDRTIRRLTVGEDILSEYDYDLDKNITALRTVMGNRNGFIGSACSEGIVPEHGKGNMNGILSPVQNEIQPPIQNGTQTPIQNGHLPIVQNGSLPLVQNGIEIQSMAQLGLQGDMLPEIQGGTQNRAENQVHSKIPYRTGQNGTLVLSDSQYTYDENGSCLTKHTIAGLTAYSYDEMNRLVKAEYPTYGEEFTYDRAGNRTGRMTGDIQEQYSYDERNRLTQLTIIKDGKSNSIDYEYDGQGNLIKDEKASYHYDAFHRMVKAELFDGNIQINHYDGEGLRHEMEENGKLVSFLYDGRNVVAEKSEETLTRYVRGYELISADCEKAKTYYHYSSDELGSITHVLTGVTKQKDGTCAEEGNVTGENAVGENESGGHGKFVDNDPVKRNADRIKNYYQYDAFGNTVTCKETVNNRFRFAGEQYDGITGQYYLRARFYNPVIGRFLQEDTYYGDGLNLYAYCASNPVYYTDPSGHEVISPSERKNPVPVDGRKDTDFYVGPDGTIAKSLEEYDIYMANRNRDTDFYVGPDGTTVTSLDEYDVYVANKNSEGGSHSPDYKYWKDNVDFNGTKVYQRNDLINPNLVDDVGRTNLQRMQNGLAPMGPDGKPINLHHLLQTNDSSIAEVAQTFHQKNTKIIHINSNQIPSSIDRNAFNTWKKQYWKNRALDFN
jgi:RHS repeat-associated protein